MDETSRVIAVIHSFIEKRPFLSSLVTYLQSNDIMTLKYYIHKSHSSIVLKETNIVQNLLMYTIAHMTVVVDKTMI